MSTDAAPRTPPVATRTPIVRSHHGDDVEDGYEWFRAKEDAAVVAHLEAENAYTEQRTAHLAGLREKIFTEIKDRTLETDLSVPTRRGDWWYYGRTVEGQQYGIQCRAPLASPDDWTPPDLSVAADVIGEQILLDGNVEAEGHEFFSLGSFEVSNDGNRMLFGIDVAGDERYTIRVRDLVTGETLPDEIPDTFAGAGFSPTAGSSCTRPSTTPGDPTPSGCTSWARPSALTRGCSTSPMSGSGSARASRAATST